jgi:uncharacterized protein DUF3309
LVESLDDFAELALHVHHDRLKKLSEHLAFPHGQGFGTTTALLLSFKENTLREVTDYEPDTVDRLFLVGGLPNWGYHSYGFAPSGIAGVVLLVVVVLLLTGRL